MTEYRPWFCEFCHCYLTERQAADHIVCPVCGGRLTALNLQPPTSEPPSSDDSAPDDTTTIGPESDAPSCLRCAGNGTIYNDQAICPECHGSGRSFWGRSPNFKT